MSRQKSNNGENDFALAVDKRYGASASFEKDGNIVLLYKDNTKLFINKTDNPNKYTVTGSKINNRIFEINYDGNSIDNTNPRLNFQFNEIPLPQIHVVNILKEKVLITVLRENGQISVTGL